MPTTASASNGHIQRSLLIVKPDGPRRGLVGTVLSRIERCGLKIVGLKVVAPSLDLAKQHYREEDIAVRHGEVVWRQLLDYITEGPVVVAAIEGVGCIPVLRKICGSTEPASAPPGTIRGDFCHHTYSLCNATNRSVRNLVHASATPEEAALELSLWFRADELHSYRRSDQSEHYLD